MERTFSPEFRNRLDAWVVFNQLTYGDITRVVDKFVNEVRAQLFEKNVEIKLDEAARKWFADKGFDKLFGATSDEQIDTTKNTRAARRRNFVRQIRTRRNCRSFHEGDEIKVNCIAAEKGKETKDAKEAQQIENARKNEKPKDDGVDGKDGKDGKGDNDGKGSVLDLPKVDKALEPVLEAKAEKESEER